MRVIIADDHRIVREGLRWMLAEHPDIEVVGEAANGRELLDLVAVTKADVCLLDVRMPEMGGLEALERLRDSDPELKVIILTMHDQPAYLKRAIELGAVGYVLKNTGRDELVRALEVVARGDAYLQGELTRPFVSQLVDGDRRMLDRRERRVLELVARGLDNRAIAAEIEMSEATVKNVLASVFEALGVKGRAEAVAVGLRLGIIE